MSRMIGLVFCLARHDFSNYNVVILRVMDLGIRPFEGIACVWLLFLGDVEAADPGGSGGGEVLTGEDFEGALLF